MTYIELVLMLAERGEKVITDRTNALYTDKFSYFRNSNGSWEQRDLPEPMVEEPKFLPLPSDGYV